MARKRVASGSSSRSVDEERLRRELVAELDKVRADLRESVAMFRMRLEGRITQVQEAVSSPDLMSEDLDKEARVEALTAMLEAIRSLRVKPEKGRRRDLKRFEALVDALAEQAASWE
ncbi:MAG: hypothetical protein GXP39_03780 [Chloroflexi bacterium]|nr:hypothetical protein [Chloroflexota bacterium]